jgi:putative sterol carrier protein
MKEEHFAALVQGKLKPMSAFLRGKLKVKGKMTLALKLQEILKK